MAKILVVDDDTLISNMYAQKFRKEGYDIIVANNGLDGLKKAKELKPDVILLDVMMPKMNGLEVLQNLKNDSSISSIPVILLTNLARNSEDIQKGLELGAVAYLVKSKVRPIDVVAKVKEVLQASGKDIELTLKPTQ